MTGVFDLQTVAQGSTIQIVDSLVEGTIIGVFAALVLRVVPRQSARTRFAVWFSSLVAIAVLPVLSGWGTQRSILAAPLSPVVTVPDSWAVYLFAAWAILAACSVIRLGRAMWHLRILRQSCVPVESDTLHPILQETLLRNQIGRAVVLCTSDRVNVPTAIGLLKPAIVIPRWALTELSVDELNQILLHEVAHLRRWDDWTNLAQHLVKAIFFFHPAVWWIEQKIALEREMACDDAVLAQTASPRAYAECLAHLAERSFVQRSLALAQAALGRLRHTSLRVAQILDVNRPVGNSSTWRPAVLLVAAFAIACSVGISRAPRFIAFREGQSVRSSPAANANAFRQPEPEFAAPPIPVTYTKAVESSQRPLRAVPARLSAVAPQRHSGPRQAFAGMKSRSSEPETDALVHQVSATSGPTLFTETVVVFVESGQNRPAVQIQMWRVTILHYVAAPSNERIPRKT
jgi:beta-lactamase regulating signal transducer with metallopeptidase domain